MISCEDTILLLTQLQEDGFEVKPQILEILKKKTVPIDTLKFINSNRQLECYKFIEKIRKSYNQGNSKLYKNLLSESEEPKTVLTTLGALQQQILLYIDKVEDTRMFLRHMRFDEIQEVFTIYFNEQNLIPAMKLLNLFKADIKIFEMFRNESR